MAVPVSAVPVENPMTSLARYFPTDGPYGKVDTTLTGGVGFGSGPHDEARRVRHYQAGFEVPGRLL
jgi:hypothetical protein